jgi:uncharacterized protein
VNDRIPLFPLHTLLFPHTDLGLHVFEERYRTLVSRCIDSGAGFGVVLIRRGREVGGPAEPHAVGTYARIAGYACLPDGRYLLEVEATRRFRIHSVHETAAYQEADVAWLSEPIGNLGTAKAQSHVAEDLLRDYRARNGDSEVPVHLPTDPVGRSYILASLLSVDPPEKQALLETESADVRLGRAAAILRRELALLDHLREERG